MESKTTGQKSFRYEIPGMVKLVKLTIFDKFNLLGTSCNQGFQVVPWESHYREVEYFLG